MAGWGGDRRLAGALLLLSVLALPRGADAAGGEAVAAASHVVVVTDRAAYRPGETVWMASWDLGRGPATPQRPGPWQAVYELVDPFGKSLAAILVPEHDGAAQGALTLSPDASGGTYLLRVRTAARRRVERRLPVAAELRGHSGAATAATATGSLRL